MSTNRQRFVQGAQGEPRRAAKAPGGGDQRRDPTQVEQAVLGAMLTERDAITEATSVLGGAQAFQSSRHQAVYRAVVSLMERGEGVDLVSVSEELNRMGDLEMAGGRMYLSEMATGVGSATNARHYAYLVHEHAIMRKLSVLGRNLSDKAGDPTQDVFDLVEDAEQVLYGIGELSSGSDPVRIGDQAEARAEEIISSDPGGGVTGITTGFPGLDRLTGGWQDTDLITLAGRPSMGKSAAGLGFALTACEQAGIPVAVFSLEMSVRQYRDRLLSALSKINGQRVRTFRVPEEDDAEPARLRGAGRRLSGLDLFVDDAPGIHISQLRSKARRLKHRHGIGLVVVDYLQLLTGYQGGNREQEVSSISQGLKAMAKELDLPVIALAQLGRSVEQNAKSIPRLSDLRESGSIENDSDVVCFVYRAEQAGITVDADGQSTEGLARLILGKQRNGPVGSVDVAFVKEFAQFQTLAQARGSDAPF